VGDVVGTVRELAGASGVTPVVVCGRNDELKARLTAMNSCVALGWVDWMPDLVASSDVLIQNAGGMTCLEAFASGVPVVSRNCIPGHGTANSVVLDAAGVAFHACSIPTLPQALDLLTPQRADGLVAAAYAMFGSCPTDFLLDGSVENAAAPAPLNPVRDHPRRRLRVSAGPRSDGGRPARGPSQPPTRPAPARHTVRRRILQGSTAVALATGLGLQLVPVASAAGVPGVRTYKPGVSKSAVYVAVRPADGVAAHWSKDLAGSVTLAADADLFEQDGPLVFAARNRGVPVVLLASGILSRGTRSEATGTAMTHHGDIVAIADHHRIGARDQFKARWSDESLIAPNHVVRTAGVKLELDGGDYILIDGRSMTHAQLLSALAAVHREARAAGLTESALPSATRSS
jgi:hypothetical protein